MSAYEARGEVVGVGEEGPFGGYDVVREGVVGGGGEEGV